MVFRVVLGFGCSSDKSFDWRFAESSMKGLFVCMVVVFILSRGFCLILDRNFLSG